MAEPSVWGAMLADPTLAFDRRALRLAVTDQRRWSRTWLYPWVRPLSRLAVTLIVAAKRPLPGRLRTHSTMDRMCVWSLRRFVSPEAGELLVRHFVVETNLLNFVVRNAGVPGVPEVTLAPTSVTDLGDRAVIQHDVNVYAVLIGLGHRARAAGGLDRCLTGRLDALDTSMLRVPAIDPGQGRRLLCLDIQTALCLMNIPFALCLTVEEYRRAVHSMRLDASLLTLLARITGDPMFLAWRPPGNVLRLRTGIDVPAAVYDHAVICEAAHEYLIQVVARQSTWDSRALAARG